MRGREWGYDDTFADLEAQGRKKGKAAERTRILDMLRAKESALSADRDASTWNVTRAECRGAMQALRSAIEWIEASK